MIIELLIFFGSIIGFTLLYWLGIPLIIPPDILPWVFFLSFTILNGVAIFLSWFYFNSTRCYQDEGNPIAMVLYYIYGHSIGHIILIVFRIISNIGYYFAVFGINMVIFGIPLISAPQEALFLAIPVAIFATEMCFNIYAITAHGTERCKTVQPMFCDCVGRDGCWCELKD